MTHFYQDKKAGSSCSSQEAIRALAAQLTLHSSEWTCHIMDIDRLNRGLVVVLRPTLCCLMTQAPLPQ
uniref:Uncharacterized protein n=1 Tax=Knipowitschia caucasica TaxID=637954 RepID=A0AAV2MJP0_KNICA